MAVELGGRWFRHPERNNEWAAQKRLEDFAVHCRCRGSLVNEDKVLTPRAQSAVKALNAAGIAFAIAIAEIASDEVTTSMLRRPTQRRNFGISSIQVAMYLEVAANALTESWVG